MEVALSDSKLYVGDEIQKRVHSKEFPKNFRMLIVGESGCGKTCLLTRLLLQPGLLNYNKLYVFTKSLYQTQYQVLKVGLEYKLPKIDIIKILNSTELCKKKVVDLEEVAESMAEYNEKHKMKHSEIECEFSEDGNDIPDPRDLDKTVRNLIVFDDIMTERKQTKAENYFTRGRSANCDCIYLSQNYIELPLHTIRTNTNFMIFFKSGPDVVEILFTKFARLDMPLKQFRELCKNAWTPRWGYLVIDRSREYESGNKYRLSLDLVH